MDLPQREISKSTLIRYQLLIWHLLFIQNEVQYSCWILQHCFSQLLIILFLILSVQRAVSLPYFVLLGVPFPTEISTCRGVTRINPANRIA